MKIEFDLEFIIKMIEEDGKMVKDVIEFYGCTRSQLSWFTRKHGLNFGNNKNQRKQQSKRMRCDMNPTKGRVRKPEEMNGIRNANIKKSRAEWEKRFAEGITYSKYVKICRSVASRKFCGEVVKFEREVDHIFSLKDCWKNKIHPDFASHINNLRVVSSKENNSKGSKSNICLKKFLLITGGQRLSKAQFNWKQVE